MFLHPSGEDIFSVVLTHAAGAIFVEYRTDFRQTNTAVYSVAKDSAGTDALEWWSSVDVFLRLGVKCGVALLRPICGITGLEVTATSSSRLKP